MKSVIRTLALALTAALAACGDPPPAATRAPLESTPPLDWKGSLGAAPEAAHVGSPTARAASNPMPGSDPRVDPVASNPMPGSDPWNDEDGLAESNTADGTGASNPMPGTDPSSQGPSASNPMPGQGPK